jgi:hypothetical protein
MSDEEVDNLNLASNTINLLDEYMEEEDLIDDLISEATVALKASVETIAEATSDHRLRPRKYINGPRDEYHQLLGNDYFLENPLYPLNIERAFGVSHRRWSPSVRSWST